MKNSSLDKFLFLLHIPPPVHGSSMVGLSIVESKLVNESFDCRFINVLASKNITETGSFSLSKLWGAVRIFIKILREFVFDRPKYGYFALTTTGFAFYRDFIVVIFMRVFGVRLIFHLHNKGISLRNSRFNRLLYSFVFKRAKVILLSSQLYTDISAYVDKKQVVYCANGIMSSLTNDLFVPTNKNEDAPVQFLFLSNLIESKGVFDLLEACSILKKRDVKFSCVFIGGEGDIDKAGFMAKCKELSLDYNEVNYLGRKFGREKDLAFCYADIFVLPTYYYNECFPLVLLEAMQYGLPTISCPEGGIADIVQDGVNGYLVMQRDVNSLADRMEALIQNKKLREMMGEKARAQFEKKFTFDVFERTLTDILKEFVTECKKDDEQ